MPYKYVNGKLTKQESPKKPAEVNINNLNMRITELEEALEERDTKITELEEALEAATAGKKK